MSCAKVVVVATLVARDGRRYVGRNDCEVPQVVCPRDRAGMGHGEGYWMCRDICRQPAHAEVQAIRLAGDAAWGSKIYLEGHYRMCFDCEVVTAAAGIEVVIGPPPTIGEGK